MAQQIETKSLNALLDSYTKIVVIENEFLADYYYMDSDFCDPVYETSSLDEWLTISSAATILWF
ncbi:hypothetical protein [Floridanema evergladense]|uniref:Uncharacterized protein n=1 Tax=Floridaenema evergladense BLCC-F167 TaxID=3153639 RepID=A0ABV4WD23_9CYAN